jgi:chain length determinant protein (polysaccharide antigen chain regulator)
LGIDNGTLSSQTYIGSSAISALVTTGNVDQTLYLRGYLALEKEMQLLAARDSAALYIPSLASLDYQQRVLMQDPAVERAQEIFALTPIGTEQFEAAVYDIASMSYKSNTKTSLVLALSIVLGGMLGVFVLLIRNAVIVKS